MSNPIVRKSWITNPRGSADVKNKTVNKTVRKEGDGGGFGDGGGVAFTSTDAGIFTPTHSERERKPKKKDKSGIGRLADFLTDNSPERKMTKGDTTIIDLVNWVKLEMRKGDRAGFHQQTSGETINNQPPRIDWARDKHKLKVEAENSSLEENKNPVEFDAKPDKTAAQQQKDEARRIRGLDDSDDKRPNAPPSVNIQLGWESGGYASDELSTGGDKDKKQGKIKDTAPKPTSEMVLQNLIKKIEDSLP